MDVCGKAFEGSKIVNAQRWGQISDINSKRRLICMSRGDPCALAQQELFIEIYAGLSFSKRYIDLRVSSV